MASSSEGLVRQPLASEFEGTPAAQGLRGPCGQLAGRTASRCPQLGEHRPLRQLTSPSGQRPPTAPASSGRPGHVAHRRAHLRRTPAAQPPEGQGQRHGRCREVLARHRGARQHRHDGPAATAPVARARDLPRQRRLPRLHGPTLLARHLAVHLNPHPARLVRGLAAAHAASRPGLLGGHRPARSCLPPSDDAPCCKWLLHQRWFRPLSGAQGPASGFASAQTTNPATWDRPPLARVPTATAWLQSITSYTSPTTPYAGASSGASPTPMASSSPYWMMGPEELPIIQCASSGALRHHPACAVTLG